MSSEEKIVPTVGSLCQDVQGVHENMKKYDDKFADSQKSGDSAVDKEEVAKDRIENIESIADTFYNLVTDFYEYGYGQSFHFAPFYDGKTFKECIAECEREVGRMIGAKPGVKILDLGCGVGGPGREIARSSGANMVGLNYCAYQIERAKKHSKNAELDHLCTYIEGDFCNMTDIEDNSYDAAFAFEATCHAKDPVLVYKEILRVLKPGGLFVDVAWSVTDGYNPQNPNHVKVKNDIMYGNSLPDIRTQKEILAAMREAGLEVMAFRDLTKDGDRPWYSHLEANDCCSFKNFRMSLIGRYTTIVTLKVLETISLAPKGTTNVSLLLEVAATSLIKSGKMEIFTPMFRCLTRKPLEQ